MRSFAVLLLSAVLLCSCAGNSTIATGMSKTPYPLSYLHDSKKIDNKAKVNLCLQYIKNETKAFPETTTVENKGTFVLPLLFINVWDVKYDCTLGKNNINEDISSFVKDKLVIESQRSGNFILLQDSNNCDYSLELTINNHITTGPYREYGNIIFLVVAVGANSSKSAGPAISIISMHLKLSKKGVVVLEKDIESSVVGRLIKSRYSSTDELQADYANSMVESLSYAFKDCIEKAIQEINSNIIQNKNQLAERQ